MNAAVDVDEEWIGERDREGASNAIIYLNAVNKQLPAERSGNDRVESQQ